MARVKATGTGVSGSGESPVFGVSTSGEASVDAGVAYADAKIDGFNISSEDGQWKDAKLVDAHAEAGVIGVEGKASGSYGIVSGEANGKIGTAEAKASGKVVLMEEGKLAPQVQLEAKAEANVAEGEIGATIGNEYIDAHAKAEGEVLHAEAHAGVGAGKITYEDENGNTQTAVGVYAEAGAEAYLAKGSISGGITVFGIKIDVKVEGKAGGAGAKAGAEISSGKIKAGLGLGFLAGLGLDVEIDWSNFKWPDFSGGKVKKITSKKLTTKSGSPGGTGRTDITVYPKKLKKEEDDFRDAYNEISRKITQINKIKNGLSISGSAASTIKSSLGTVVEGMEQQKKNLKKVADTIEDIAELYISTEKSIMS